jgi:hypothetical protein
VLSNPFEHVKVSAPRGEGAHLLCPLCRGARWNSNLQLKGAIVYKLGPNSHISPRIPPKERKQSWLWVRRAVGSYHFRLWAQPASTLILYFQTPGAFNTCFEMHHPTTGSRWPWPRPAARRTCSMPRAGAAPMGLTTRVTRYDMVILSAG